MKTTVDIPEETLKEAMQHCQAKTKREAIVTAMEEYNRRQRLKRVLGFLGTMDGIMTQEELRRMREDG